MRARASLVVAVVLGFGFPGMVSAAKLVGAGDSNLAIYAVAEHETFLYRVGTALGFNPIVNAGIPGYYSAGTLTQMDSLVTQAPNMLIISVGGNDVFAAVERGQDREQVISHYLANMDGIITKAKAANIPFILLTPAPSHLSNDVNSMMSQLSSRLMALCTNRGAHCIDVFHSMLNYAAGNTEVLDSWFKLKNDDHTGPAGHAFIANLIIRNWPAAQTASPVSGNVFATLNPTDIPLQAGEEVGLSSGNLSYSGSASINQYRKWNATLKPASGKYYFEMRVDDIGITDTGSQTLSVGGIALSQNGNVAGASYSTSWTAGDIIGVAVSPSGVWFSRNGTWLRGATISEIESGNAARAAGVPAYPLIITAGDGSGNLSSYSSGTFNFGQGSLSGSASRSAAGGSFVYQPPSGFTALSTNPPTTLASTNTTSSSTQSPLSTDVSTVSTPTTPPTTITLPQTTTTSTSNTAVPNTVNSTQGANIGATNATPSFTPSTVSTTAVSQPMTAPAGTRRSVQTTAVLNVRAAPSASAHIVARMPVGATGETTGRQASGEGYTWMEIRYADGTAGWSAAEYLYDRSTTAAATEIAAPTSLPANNCAITRTLMRGSRGSDVSALQQYFVRIYGNFTEDYVSGFFGPLTEAALKQWQSERGIVLSGTPETTGYGVMGPRTRAAFQAACISR